MVSPSVTVLQTLEVIVFGASESVREFSGFDEDLIKLSNSIENRIMNGMGISSAILHGPPGHGKTEFVKRLR